MTTLERPQVQQALQSAIDAVDTLFATREIRPGEHMHVALVGGNETTIARALLPILSGTHLGRMIRNYGRELISDYR